MNLRHALTALGVGILLSIVSTPAALAHAAYESSDPANGSSVSSPPSRVTATFTEPVVDGSRLDVYDPCGDKVDNGDSLVAGDQITISMSADKQGRYTVTFDVVSAVDSHNTKGEFGFTSSGGAPCAGAVQEEEEAPSEQSQGGGGGGGGGGAGTQPDSGSGVSESTDSDASAGSEAGRSGAGGREEAKEGNRQASNRSADKPSFAARNRPRARVPNIQPIAASAEGQQPNILDGIPLGTFAIGLVLAAVIGAAGGKIYAGIMGWTRPRDRKVRNRS